MELNVTAANPFIQINAGDVYTLIDYQGLRTSIIVTDSIKVGKGVFFNAEHIFMKSGIGSQGEDLYSGRVGDYDSNGLAFIENNLNGYVKVNCSELTGNVYVTGSTVRYYTLTNLLDIRFKKAVKKVPYGLNELLDLNPISFKYKLPENDSIQDEDKVHFGFPLRMFNQLCLNS